MATTKPRVKVPKATAGEIISIRTLISHRMESGFRLDPKTGKPIPRRIINKFQVNFEGAEIFSVDMGPGIAANPYFMFPMRAEKSGTLEFIWIDDTGERYSITKQLVVG